MFFIVSALSLSAERTEVMMTKDAVGISAYKKTKISINVSLAPDSLSSYPHNLHYRSNLLLLI